MQLRVWARIALKPRIFGEIAAYVGLFIVFAVVSSGCTGPPLAPKDSAAQDSAAQDSAAQDGAAQDGAAQDGATQDGATQDGATQDNAAEDATIATDAPVSGSDAAAFDTAAFDAGNIPCTTDTACAAALKDTPLCRVATCSAQQVCVFAPVVDGSVCGDPADLCSAADSCIAGSCVAGKNKACVAGGPCQTGVCDKSDGSCSYEPLTDGTKCDDGDDCSPFSTCTAGTCVAESTFCLCSEDDVSKCWTSLQPALDKNDLCAGRPKCVPFITAKGDKLRRCVFNALTVVSCDAKKDTECVVNSCQTTTGKCVLTPRKDGLNCEDGSVCTNGDSCQSGKCKPGVNICFCSPTGGVDNCYGFADGQVGFGKGSKCRGTVFCASVAVPGSKLVKYVCKVNKLSEVECDTSSDTACLKTTCDESTGTCGTASVFEGKAACDDGNNCTANDLCLKGVCVGTVPICMCSKAADCAAKEDGDLCNGTLYCDLKSGQCKLNPATIVTCADANDTGCLRNICFPATGTCELTPRENIQTLEQFTPVSITPGNIKQVVTGTTTKPYGYKKMNAFCTDGNACTVGEQCDKGVCSGGTDLCTCSSDAECVVKEDGNSCNGTLYCDLATGTCKVSPVTVVSCDNSGDNLCAVTTCAPKTGVCALVAAKDGSPCEDGTLCTAGDSCKTGKCQSGVMICQCQKDVDCVSREDGDLCNGTLYCDTTQKDNDGNSSPRCVVNPATIRHCPTAADSDCRANQCVPQTGQCKMLPANEYLPCDAENPVCYASPTCSNGKCAWETNLCACSADKDCAYLLGSPGKQDFCLGAPYCDKTDGFCKLSTSKVPLCLPSNGDDCNAWTCDPKSGKCAFFAKNSFTPCDDGQPCTLNDRCDALKGALGALQKKATCASGTDVCQCKTTADCQFYDDGNPCNGTLYCDKADGSCKVNLKSAVTCASTPTKNSCVIQVCSPKTGACVSATDPGKCDDGDACTMATCKKTLCVYSPVSPKTACLDKTVGAGVCLPGKAAALVCTPSPLSDLRLIPAGKTAVGCDGNALTCPSTTEKPQHFVSTDGFWMQRYEVTVGQYTACVKSGVCSKPTAGAGCSYGRKATTTYLAPQQHPMTCVTWQQANDFCGSIHAKARLPREVEWARAARGGCALYTSCAKDAFVYVWGNHQLPNCSRSVHRSLVSGKGCGSLTHDQVGSLLKGDESLYGINDLSGNVSEWVADYYGATWFAQSGASTANTTGPAAGVNRVVRGGSWNDLTTGVNRLRIDWRGGMNPNKGYTTVGFRCVIPLN